MTLGRWLPVFMTEKGGEDSSALFAEHRAALEGYFRRRAPSGEVEDLVQEVFVRLLARRAGDPIQDPERYLFRVAAAVLADHHRRSALRKAEQERHLSEAREFDAISPERSLIDIESLDCILAALEQLPPRTRHAFVLHRFENMTYAEIALRMGVTRSGVEKLIMRALSQLMAALESAG
jgi:RNA polymerase sigma-70 factor (ECF subfamily)